MPFVNEVFDINSMSHFGLCLFTGNIELLRCLISKGVDINSQSDAGSPLIWAAGHDQPDAVKVLLEHHANVSHHLHISVTYNFILCSYLDGWKFLFCFLNENSRIDP